MKVESLKSACVLVEANGVKILTDPWLADGEYFGSWAHYPPYDFDPGQFAELDFIYISHIHPDHFSRKTQAVPHKAPNRSNLVRIVWSFTSIARSVHA